MSMSNTLFARADEVGSMSVDGAEQTYIPAGMRMHVFHQDGEWVHVIIPDREINWQISWSGTYGFIY